MRAMRKIWVPDPRGTPDGPNIGVSRGHDAVEWSRDALECLLYSFQPVYDRLVNNYRGLAAMIIAGGRIEVLRRDHIRFQKLLIATVGNLRQIPRGRCDPQLRLSLGELLINFRGVDVGQDSSRLDPSANIKIPGFQVSAGLSEDRRDRRKGMVWPGN